MKAKWIWRSVATTAATGLTLIGWPTIKALPYESVAPIASTVATISGVLVGFVIASLTVLSSASSNILKQNTVLTGYYNVLIGRLGWSMMFLLSVCVTFLLLLFVPKGCTVFGTNLYALITAFGVFLFVLAVILFYSIWRSISGFVSNM